MQEDSSYIELGLIMLVLTHSLSVNITVCTAEIAQRHNNGIYNIYKTHILLMFVLALGPQVI